MVITTGGTGPSKKDLTPNATREVIEEELPGFGEYMRSESLKYSKNAILSRQLAGIRKDSIILNLPGSPNSIGEILPNIIDQIIHFVVIHGLTCSYGAMTSNSRSKSFMNYWDFLVFRYNIDYFSENQFLMVFDIS